MVEKAPRPRSKDATFNSRSEPAAQSVSVDSPPTKATRTILVAPRACREGRRRRESRAGLRGAKPFANKRYCRRRARPWRRTSRASSVTTQCVAPQQGEPAARSPISGGGERRRSAAFGRLAGNAQGGRARAREAKGLRASPVFRRSGRAAAAISIGAGRFRIGTMRIDPRRDRSKSRFDLLPDAVHGSHRLDRILARWRIRPRA